MSQPILIIDNYDSFTYNIVHAAALFRPNCVVAQNDQITIDEIHALNPSHIILGPGPKRPADAGILLSCIAQFHQDIPMLGICLGHQAIGEFFGGTVCKAPLVQHGKTAWIQHSGTGIFQNLPTPMAVGRYHSLCVENLPDVLQPIAFSPDGVIQAFQHHSLPIFGVQFHPESILTPDGSTLIQHFFEIGDPHVPMDDHRLFQTTL